MSNSNGIITKPINVISDIGYVLGSSSGDVGTLCRHSAINPMSKFKPVAFPYPEPSRTQAVSAYDKTLWWWKGHPSVSVITGGITIGTYHTTEKCAWITCCGVKYIGFTSKIDLVKAFDPIYNRYDEGDTSPLSLNYSHVAPSGGVNSEPYRMFDFDNYDHSANFNVVPDYGTESGTKYVNANNPESARVKCSVMSQAVLNYGGPSELSFNDLFSQVGSACSFTLVCAKLSGDSYVIVNPSLTNTRNDDYFKEISVNLNDSSLYGNTIIAFYCAAITVGQDIYYVPLMQSSGYHPNTPISYAPNRKVYNSWRVENSTPYYAMTALQKQNYGPDTSFPYSAINTMTSFDARDTESVHMNRWYLKIGAPKKPSSGYTLANTSFKIELTGEFLNEKNQLQLLTYTLTSEETRFVLKNEQVTTAADWGTTEQVVVTAGSGTQTCYLAMYDVFDDNRQGVCVTKGGTIWRVAIYMRQSSGTFPAEPDLVYGSLDSSHLNINVTAVDAE